MRFSLFTFISCLSIVLLGKPSKLDDIDALIKNKKYASAFQKLLDQDKKLNDPIVVSKMAEIATNYHVYCVNNESFSFKDLEPNETISQIRNLKQKTELVNFKIEEELLKLTKKNPKSGVALLALANYYFSGLCDLPQSKVLLAESYFKKAEGLVEFDYLSNHNIGVIFLQNNQFKKGIEYLLISVKQNENYAGTHYNLAFAYYNLGKSEQALVHAENAFKLYEDKKLKSEAALLVAVIYFDLKDKEKTKKYAMLANQYKFENHYYILTKLLELYIKADEMALADKTADELISLDPTNPKTSEDVLDTYSKFKRKTEFISVMERNEKKYKNNSIALGNLFFQRGKFYFTYFPDKNKAIASLNQAKSHFQKEFKSDHPALIEIDKTLKKLESTGL